MIWESRDTENGFLHMKQGADLKNEFQTKREITTDK